MSALFSPFKLRDLTFPNRVFVSPMCEYSSDNGLPNEWHMVHLGSRAVGGAGLVLTEASGVTPEGRISPQDAGLWSEAHAQAWAPIVKFIKAQGVAAGMQLAHAGRKASTFAPWRGHGAVPEGCGGWPVLGPSAVKFADSYPQPHAMTEAGIDACVRAFADATHYAQQAGFDVVEIHMAHGYLMHEFLSPLSNQRTDQYGGALENRMRLPLRVADTVRKAWPAHLPVFVRISASDWAEGGWDLVQSIELCKRMKALGIDLIDVPSGGNVHHQAITLMPGYQVPFCAKIRDAAAMPASAVGLITDAVQAEQIVATGQADAVMLARALLRDPYWPRHAAALLGAQMQPPWPDQYQRAVVGPLGK